MLSGAKNVASTLQNGKLHHALSVNCQPQSRLNSPANRLCYKLSRRKQSVPGTCSRHREDAIADCWAARWRHDQRRCWSRLETATNFSLKCRNSACRNNACRNNDCRNSACRNRNCLPLKITKIPSQTLIDWYIGIKVWQTRNYNVADISVITSLQMFCKWSYVCKNNIWPK